MLSDFLILVAVMFYGFQWYSGASRAWKTMLFVPRVFTAFGLLVFGAADVFWNATYGTITFLELPFQKVKGAKKWYLRQWTFSLRVEHWHNESRNDWRKMYLLGADNWTSLLNSVVPNHIITY